MPKEIILTAITKQLDPVGLYDEVAFKCSLKCPANFTCLNFNGSVEWFANSIKILDSDLTFDAGTNSFYSLLVEEQFFIYMNQKVSFFKLLYY